MIKELAFNILPIEKYIELKYKRFYQKKLDLEKPVDFSEKLYWLRLYYGIYRKDEICKLYDKYTCREYVAKTIGEKYLTKLYGVYENANEIRFDELPDEYVLKITQSCGKNLIINKNNSLSTDEIINIMNEWLSVTNDKKNIIKEYKEDYYFYDGNAQILCEEYLSNDQGNIPEDIRVYCFNGKAEFITIDYDSVTYTGEKKHVYVRNSFDTNGNFIPLKFGRENDIGKNKFPKDILPELLNVAEHLAQPFPFVRVDMYNVNGSIKFGELTWIPMGGNCKIEPEEYEKILGEKIQLPEINELDATVIKKNIKKFIKY